MSKQISKTAIGGFIVSAIVLLVAAVMIFGSGQFWKKTYKFVLFFDGSIKGLKVGAPVLFRGVEIGSVEKISIRTDPQGERALIPVLINIDPGKIEFERKVDLYKEMPGVIKRGFKAQLTLASIVTGQLLVELDFYPDKPIRLIGTNIEYQEIPTIPSAVEQIAQTLRDVPIKEIFEKLERAIDGLENAVNSPQIPKIINSLDLALQETHTLVQNLNENIASLGSSAEETLTDYSKLARNVDARIEPLASGIEETTQAATEALVQAKKSLATIENTVGEESVVAYELTNVLKEIAAAARSLRILADYFERHPDALMQGKGEAEGK